MDLEPGSVLSGSSASGSVIWVHSWCWPGLGSYLKACLGKDPLPGSCDCWKNFSSLRVEGLSSQLAVGQRPGSSPCHVDLSNMATCFVRTGKGQHLLVREESQSYVL